VGVGPKVGDGTTEDELMAKRLNVKLERKIAMQVNRVSIGKKKLVYVLLAQKPFKYPWGPSKVVYIGTTKKGMDRISQSVAARADDVLGLRGVRLFTVRILTCRPRPNVKTWVKLERALLLVFRHKYRELPMCNAQGKKMKLKDEFDYFKRDRLEKLLDKLAA
jgi:hypothetical protein